MTVACFGLLEPRGRTLHLPMPPAPANWGVEKLRRGRVMHWAGASMAPRGKCVAGKFKIRIGY